VSVRERLDIHGHHHRFAYPTSATWGEAILEQSDFQWLKVQAKAPALLVQVHGAQGTGNRNPESNPKSAGRKAPAEVAIEFLQQLRPRGPWVLSAIIPDGEIETITTSDPKEVDAFVLANDGTKNLYYSVNPLRRAMSKKAAKIDIAAVEYALADLDPNSDETPEAAKARYLHQLNGMFEPKPTAIIDSGNGIQCLWRLAQPIKLGKPIKDKDGKLTYGEQDLANIANVEARIAAVMVQLGSKAGTQNIDRILRLPGTANLPNKTKLKAGRVACPTRLISFNGATYPLEAFPLDTGTAKQQKQKQEQKSSSRLPPHLAMMLHVSDPGGGHRCGDYASRSEALYAFIILAMRAGIDENTIINVLLDEQYIGKALYAHCHEQSGNAADYLRRQIEHAINNATPPPVLDDKRLIRVLSSQQHTATDATQKALVAANCPVYFRADALVEPLWRWEKTSEHNRDALVCRFVKLNPARLSYMVGKHAAIYQKWDDRKRIWKTIQSTQGAHGAVVRPWALAIPHRAWDYQLANIAPGWVVAGHVRL